MQFEKLAAYSHCSVNYSNQTSSLIFAVGGMNKSRQTPAQGKKVQPPTVPVTASLVSFASFRIKKNQQPPQLQLEDKDPDSPRYSGSSLGSTGSSYNSAGSSSSTSSGSSDNRSSIGTDDGFMLPAPNGYILKG